MFPFGLSDREAEVFLRLAEGSPPKEIASDLGIARDTVRNHMHRVKKKMKARTMAQAILWFYCRFKDYE